MSDSQKLIWLDGATGTLGQAVHSHLTAAGYRVLALTRSESTATEFPLTVTFTEDTLANISKGWIKQWGPPTGLVCMSGVNLNKLLLRTTHSDWMKLLDANLLHQSNLIQCLLPELMIQEHGSIVLCSSLAALHPRIGQAAYSATKGAIESFTRGLAREIASKNIRINAIAPGFIDSTMFSSLPMQKQKSILAHIPLGRTGQPTDVAATIEFLLSDQSHYMTGQTIRVDGGAS